jgi:hypothetical protein
VIEYKRDNFPKQDHQRSSSDPKYYRFIDKDGNEYIGTFSAFNNSGYREQETNREIYPVGWAEY